MKGLEVLMKSFGINPDMLKIELSKASEAFKQELAKIHGRFDSIDNRLNEIEARLPKPVLTLVEKGNGTDG